MQPPANVIAGRPHGAAGDFNSAPFENDDGALLQLRR